MTMHISASPAPYKAKALAAAILLCVAGSAHSPRVEASGIPTFDLSNLTQMLMEWGTDAIKSCFNVNSVKEAVTRVQDIQRFAQRARVMNNMTELMPERDELEGVESCPNPSGGGMTGAAAGWARNALSMGNTRIDGSTDLRTLQQQLCVSDIVLQNRKWNAERELLLELEGQTRDYQEILGKWNSMADMKGQVEAICNMTPGGGSMGVSGGGANEGRQMSLQQELAQRTADNARELSDRQSKISVLEGAIASVQAKQAEVGRKMLNGEGGGLLTGAAAGAIQATLLKGALETAKSD
jgi:hypothetical protein